MTTEHHDDKKPKSALSPDQRQIKTSSGKEYSIGILLGEGSFGTVHRISLIGEDNNIDSKNVRCLKTLKKSKMLEEGISTQEIVDEAIFLQKKTFPHGAPSEVFEDNENIYIISDYAPGEQLFSKKGLSPKVKKLTFEQKIELLQKIALSIQLIHNDTWSTGRGVIHKDLKGANIHVDIKTDEVGNVTAIEVYILDFGLSHALSPDYVDSSVLQKTKVDGTIYYLPPEVGMKLGGTKSDVYSLAPLFWLIMEGNDPFEEKKAEYRNEKNEAKKNTNTILAPYSFDKIKVSKKYTAVGKYLAKFIKIMGSQSYNGRSDSDVLLKFTTTFSNMCKQCKEEGVDDVSKIEDFHVYEAKLALLTAGLLPVGGGYDFRNAKINKDIVKIVDRMLKRKEKNRHPFKAKLALLAVGLSPAAGGYDFEDKETNEEIVEIVGRKPIEKAVEQVEKIMKNGGIWYDAEDGRDEDFVEEITPNPVSYFAVAATVVYAVASTVLNVLYSLFEREVTKPEVNSAEKVKGSNQKIIQGLLTSKKMDATENKDEKEENSRVIVTEFGGKKGRIPDSVTFYRSKSVVFVQPTLAVTQNDRPPSVPVNG